MMPTSHFESTTSASLTAKYQFLTDNLISLSPEESHYRDAIEKEILTRLLTGETTLDCGSPSDHRVGRTPINASTSPEDLMRELQYWIAGGLSGFGSSDLACEVRRRIGIGTIFDGPADEPEDGEADDLHCTGVQGVQTAMDDFFQHGHDPKDDEEFTNEPPLDSDREPDEFSGSPKPLFDKERIDWIDEGPHHCSGDCGGHDDVDDDDDDDPGTFDGKLNLMLRSALNSQNAERVSQTPDYVLANFLSDCLAAFDRAAIDRDDQLIDDLKK